MKAVRRRIWIFVVLITVVAPAVAQPGSNVWTYTSNSEPILASPAIGPDGTIYVGSYDQALHAVDPATGARKWRFSVAPSIGSQVAYIYSTPAVGADGTIYFGTDQQNFKNGAFSGNLYAVSPTGTEKWKFPVGSSIYSDPAIGPDGTIYFGCYDKYLYAVDPAGNLKWKFLAGDTIFSDPTIAADGTIYFGCDDHQVYALNSGGTLRWTLPTGGAVTASPAIGQDGTVYVGSIDNLLYAIRVDGSTNWVVVTGANVNSSAAVGPDGTIYFGSDDQNLYALRADGTEKWRYHANGAVRSSPALAADGSIYFGAEDGLVYAIDRDGGFLWSFATGAYVFASPAIGTNGTVYAASADHYLYALEGSSGLSVGSWPMFRYDVAHSGRKAAGGNRPPTIVPVGDHTIYEGETSVITIIATDPDLPPNQLTYQLTAGPEGAAIDPASGAFDWTPTPSDANTTNLIAITVTDDGSPTLSASTTFTVTVVEWPLIESIVKNAGGMELTWSSIPGRLYRVQWKSSLSDSLWNDLPGDVQALGETASKIDDLIADQQRFYRVVISP